MAKGGKMKAKVEEDEAPEESVIVLSSDEEANEDLTLKIVEKSRSREAKKMKKQTDFDEFKASEGFRAASVINLSSSSDELEVVGDGSGGSGGAVVSYEAAVVVKKKKSRKKKKKSSVKVVEEEKRVNILNSEESVEAIKSTKTEAAAAVETEELAFTVKTEKIAKPMETEAAGTIETDELVYTVHVKKADEPVETSTAAISDNIVLRKLLRGPRYFDPPNSSVSTCYNCGEEGHMAFNCTSKKRKKPCFVCGSFEHAVRNCKQGKDCYICKKSGHRAKNCPEKNQASSMNLDICLRCGESGHTMFSCTSDYDPQDLKGILCYVCKKLGHLCCVDTLDAGTGEVSCYNCGQSGHSGSGCAKQRGETSGVGAPTLCYKCGEEGHFARGCTTYAQPDRRVAGSSTPIKKFKKKDRNSAGFQSVPRDLSKVRKKKNVEYGGRNSTGFQSGPPEFKKVSKKKYSEHEVRNSATPGRGKRRGGWITDDPGDLPNRKFKPNVWVSPTTPTTPTNKYHRPPNVTSGGHFSNSGSPWGNPNYNYGTPTSHGNPDYMYGTPSSHGSANYYQHRYSASRFGNSSNGWDGRNHGW